MDPLFRTRSPVNNSIVVLAAIKGGKTVRELVQHFDVHENQITQWKTQLLERGGGGGSCLRAVGIRNCRLIDLKALHAKIGKLTLENDLLEGALTKAGLAS